MDADKPQPGIDLGWLETAQRVVQYGAILAVVATVVLVLVASRKLAAVNRELNERQAALGQTVDKLTAVDAELKKREARVVALNEQIQTLQTRLDTSNAAMRAIESPGTRLPEGDPGPPVEIPARVYVQIFDETQRQRAREMQRALEGAHFVVPGIENVGKSKAPYQQRSDVRFYGGATKTSDVDVIRSIASRFGVDLKETPLKPSTGVRPRHYELWLGKDFATPR